MVVMGEERRRLDLLSLFGSICQLFGYSHNTVALALCIRCQCQAHSVFHTRDNRRCLNAP